MYLSQPLATEIRVAEIKLCCLFARTSLNTFCLPLLLLIQHLQVNFVTKAKEACLQK